MSNPSYKGISCNDIKQRKGKGKIVLVLN